LNATLLQARAPRTIDVVARRLLCSRLERLRLGRLTLRDAGTTSHFGHAAAGTDLAATVHVHDAAFYGAVAFGGSVGAAESYARGEWSADNLTNVVRVLIRNREVLDDLETGFARLASPVRRVLHSSSRNTRAGSRRNIEAHYDLGNDLFALFRDPSLTYSCALFERAHMSLEDAQVAKIDRICRKLALVPTDHLLEIGTGWGALALHAAREYGCRVTTATISPSQYAVARDRVRDAGLEDRVQVQLSDYRDLTGVYDKLVSVEMLEAVGHHFYDAFFRKASDLLRPDGSMLLQTITIADQQYEAAKRSVDFIQRYIFPGSTIPSVAAITQSVARASDLRLFHLEDIGPFYARTLREWRERFLAGRARIRALGYSDQFIRMWEFYFCYCEGGFEERALGDAQMLLTKPGTRRNPVFFVST
jgi:cyclopropane-fatty-acyl-phospholipid synthase